MVDVIDEDDGDGGRLQSSVRSSRRSRSGSRDKTDTSVSFSVSTMESKMTARARERARRDLEDEGNPMDPKNAPKPWFCYRLILACLLAVFVCVTCFMISCESFRYESWDDGVQYYGIRGVTDQTTGRCVHWQIQDVIDWNTTWTNERLPMLFIFGMAGVTFVIAISVAWVAYGIILKAKRDRAIRRSDPPPASHICGGPIGPAVIIGVCLIGAGLLMFITILGNCANVPPISYDRGLRCNLHTWSSIALVASIVLCFMGGSLAFFLKCCCNRCMCTTFLRKQLIET
jgi:hypothetical protein